MNNTHATKDKTVTFRLPVDLRVGLELVQARDGVPISEQMRRALRLWLEEKRALKKGGR